MLLNKYFRIEKNNLQSTVIGNIRFETEKTSGIIISIAYFGEALYYSKTCKFRNDNYTRAINNYLGFSIDKSAYGVMSKGNLNELMNLFNFNEEEKERVLEQLQTYYISRKIGDAYLELFSIQQQKEIISNLKQLLLKDNEFLIEVRKQELEKELLLKNDSFKNKLNKV